MNPVRRILGVIVQVSIMLMVLVSCSTTKVVPDGSYRLKKNKVEIVNHKQYPRYKVSDIQPYIRQKPNTYYIAGWNPFIYVYNWTSQQSSGWDRFVEKIGQAPVIFDPDMIESSKENMNTHLKFLGYYNSVILDSLVKDDKLVEVLYEVHLGKQYPIKEITYVVKDSLVGEFIKADTLNSLITRGAPLSEKLLETESERVATMLKNNGYYGFSKNYLFFTADTLSVKDSALLEIRVENYTRNEMEKDAKKHRRFYFGNVTIYPVSDVIRYRAAVARKTLPHLDTLKYGNILVLYDRELDIRPSVLDNMNRVQSDSLYREDVVNSTYQRLSNLHLFNSVNVQLDQTAQDTVDCNIRLVPSKIQGYEINLEASTNSTGLIGLSPVLSYYNRNIFKGGEWLNLSLMGNFQFAVNNKKIRSNEFGGTASISFPTMLFIPDKMFKSLLPRTDVSFAYNFQQRPEYTRNMMTAQFGYSWNTTMRNFYYNIYPMKINIVKMSNLSPGFIESLKNPFLQDSYKDHFDLGGGATFSYTTDPSANPENSYFKANLQFDMAGNTISAFNKLMPTDTSGKHTIWGSPYSQYVRCEVSLVYTKKFGGANNQALAMRLLGGIGLPYGNSTAMPFERMFWAGGANSLRGWQARSVGPGTSPMDTTFSIPNQIGDARLEANIEYRFPLFWMLNGAFFFDAGNVWNIRDKYFANGNFLKALAFNTGLGIRLDVQFLIVRLDFGVKLHDPSAQEWRGVNKWFKRGGYAFQFGIGYPF